ncbi:MAG: FAD-dependent oxidoreductase, partial [Pseudolabrys sp.]|nr:FAD-dependent oxidoreductase [Pseudolabrys sp.]
NPLVGPVRGLQNYWVACGVMAGLSQGGGVGMALSNWMADGDPGADIWGMDVARYGNWTTVAYTNAKVRENYSRRFRVRFPNEELPAARKLKTTPIYEELTQRGAMFGASYGLEFAAWYAPKGTAADERWGFERTNAFAPMVAEVNNTRANAGLMEISTYAKYAVTGLGAESFLSRVLAGRIPKLGRIALNPMLNEAGKIIGDFTVARLADNEFFIIGAGVAEDYHMRWFERHLPPSGVHIRSFGVDLVGLSVAGPKSREILSRLVRDDLSTAAFPFLSIRRMDVGLVPALVARISFTGDLGYEIWVKPEHQRALFDALMAAGEPYQMGLFGARALNAMRLEKGYGSWAREYRPIYTPREAGMDRLINMTKGDFIGRQALMRLSNVSPTMTLTKFAVDATNADAFGDEPILCNGKIAGWVTSGGYSPTTKKSLAMGYVFSEFSDRDDGFSIEIIGEKHPAQRLAQPLFDPEGARLKA